MPEREKTMLRNVIKFIIAAMLLASCDGDKKAEVLEATHCDSLIFAVGSVKDYDTMLALTDSFETTGGISTLTANR